MKKDILDVKKYIRYDFDKPKSLYKINFYIFFIFILLKLIVMVFIKELKIY